MDEKTGSIDVPCDKSVSVGENEGEQTIAAPVGTSKAAKAVVWYTFGSVLLKGISFISTPIFTRLLTKEEFGAYSNITTFASLLTIFSTLELSASMFRARTDFKSDMHRYMFSLLPFGNLITGVLYVFACIFMSDIERIFTIDSFYVHLIFIVLLVSPATTMLTTYLRYIYKYKLSTVISVGTAILHIVVSLGFVLALENNLFGRTFGHYIVSIVIGVVCYIYLLVKGRKVKASYFTYAIQISFPLVFHLLSMYILGQSDKLMITAICGNEANALYSLAYSCGIVLSFVWSSLNSAFSPIIGDSLASGNSEYTHKMTFSYLTVYIVPTFLLMLLAPELVFIMGGEPYAEAVNVIPPVTAGSIIQYTYTLYVNVEQYDKKTWRVALGTAIAAAANIGLNALLIPIFGYIAAAYTTLFCYLLLLLIHFTSVKLMKKTHYYNTKVVFGIVAMSLVFTGVSTILYFNNIVRLVIAGIYVAIVALLMYKYKSRIINLFRSKRA